MVLMGLIDWDMCNVVIDEFCDKLEVVGFSFLGSIDGMLDFLDGYLLFDILDWLWWMVVLNGMGDFWDWIVVLFMYLLVELVCIEVVEIVVVMFFKLFVFCVVEVFVLLDLECVCQIVYVMLLIGMIEVLVLCCIGQVLIQVVDVVLCFVIEGKVVDKVGVILNFLFLVMCDMVLVGLDDDDVGFVGEVCKMIFIFVYIVSWIDLCDIVCLICEVEGVVMIKVLVGVKGVNQVMVDFLLGGLFLCLVEFMCEEMEVLGKVLGKDVEDVMDQVVVVICWMEVVGELVMIVFDFDEEGVIVVQVEKVD